ncbi:YjdF family protein [Leuconostoc lactis]|uniref:YjdF family protein n=1 Tax=Leuconostoc lactis TaxID=1246 RepID=UPI0015F3F828|nr:YjdF family protein [Leuconostoc lactis]MBA5813326.1 YjdF family protein [Leuconostoc lactis]
MHQNNNSLSLTIIFDQPFYIGVFERKTGDVYEVSKINLGTSEPRDSLIYELLIENWHHVRFNTVNIANNEQIQKKISPKRMQRLAKKDLKSGLSTKAQEAVKLAQTAQKLEKKKHKSLRNQEIKDQRYLLSQKKKSEKHRGH